MSIMVKNRLKIITAILFALFQLSMLFCLWDVKETNAQINFKPQVDMGTFQAGVNRPVSSDTQAIAEYIREIYKYLIGIVGIVAVVMMMFAGVLWIMSGGNQTQVQTAKSYIASSLIGLVLVLCSYVILKTINPNLVNFQIISIPQVVKIDTTNLLSCCQKPKGSTENKCQSNLAQSECDTPLLIGYSCNPSGQCINSDNKCLLNNGKCAPECTGDFVEIDELNGACNSGIFSGKCCGKKLTEDETCRGQGDNPVLQTGTNEQTCQSIGLIWNPAGTIRNGEPGGGFEVCCSHYHCEGATRGEECHVKGAVFGDEPSGYCDGANCITTDGAPNEWCGPSGNIGSCLNGTLGICPGSTSRVSGGRDCVSGYYCCK